MNLTEVPTADLDSILAELDHGEERLPRKAIQAARENREAITPRLIQVLENGLREAEDGEYPEGNAVWLSLLLLAEFRATEALPAVRRVFSLDNDSSYEWFGDMLTESGDQILLSVSGDRTDVLADLLRDDGIPAVSRSVVGRGFVLLARDNVITREQARDFLLEGFRQAALSKNVELTSFLLGELLDVKATEALDDIEQAYRDGLVDPTIVGTLTDVKRELSDPKVHHVSRKSRHIDDVIAELQTWSGFQEPERSSSASHLRSWSDFADNDPVVPRTEHVGRNDPCPCGSGKKFKKCCYGR